MILMLKLPFPHYSFLSVVGVAEVRRSEEKRGWQNSTPQQQQQQQQQLFDGKIKRKA